MKKKLKEIAGAFKDAKVIVGVLLGLGLIASNVVDFSRLPARMKGIEECMADDAKALEDETVAREKEDVSINHAVDKLANNIGVYLKQTAEHRIEHQEKHTESMDIMLRYIDAKTQ